MFDVFRAFASRCPTRQISCGFSCIRGGVARVRLSQPCTAPTARRRLNSARAPDGLPNWWIPVVFGLAPTRMQENLLAHPGRERKGSARQTLTANCVGRRVKRGARLLQQKSGARRALRGVVPAPCPSPRRPSTRPGSCGPVDIVHQAQRTFGDHPRGGAIARISVTRDRGSKRLPARRFADEQHFVTACFALM